MNVVIRCPRCLSDDIPIPAIQAPEGHAFDATMVLVTCRNCHRMSSLSDCTEER